LKNIIIGIDGGGTKTKAAALDENGRVVAQAESGSMNYNFLPVDECVSNVCGAIKRLALDGDFYVKACAVGDASIDDEVTHVLSEKFIGALRAQAGFDNNIPIFLKSDVFMSLYGLTEGEPGVLLISGTGSMGMGIDKQGNIVTAGGWGRPGTDKGSGYDIAVRALSAVFEASDGTGFPTKLTEKALRFFRVDKPRELIGIFNDDNCTRADIAAFARAVDECAKEGDPAAIGVIRDAADSLAGYACALIKRIDDPACHVGMYGGVFQHNLDIQKYFKEAVYRIFPQAVVGFPQTPPEIAAAIYAINTIKSQSKSQNQI
jgi:N-acetylglucosamine kinase-like BadF-type ATPase